MYVRIHTVETVVNTEDITIECEQENEGKIGTEHIERHTNLCGFNFI